MSEHLRVDRTEKYRRVAGAWDKTTDETEQKRLRAVAFAKLTANKAAVLKLEVKKIGLESKHLLSRRDAAGQAAEQEALNRANTAIEAKIAEGVRLEQEIRIRAEKKLEQWASRHTALGTRIENHTKLVGDYEAAIANTETLISTYKDNRGTIGWLLRKNSSDIRRLKALIQQSKKSIDASNTFIKKVSKQHEFLGTRAQKWETLLTDLDLAPGVPVPVATPAPATPATQPNPAAPQAAGGAAPTAAPPNNAAPATPATTPAVEAMPMGPKHEAYIQMTINASRDFIPHLLHDYVILNEGSTAQRLNKILRIPNYDQALTRYMTRKMQEYRTEETYDALREALPNIFLAFLRERGIRLSGKEDEKFREDAHVLYDAHETETSVEPEADDDEAEPSPDDTHEEALEPNAEPIQREDRYGEVVIPAGRVYANVGIVADVAGAFMRNIQSIRHITDTPLPDGEELVSTIARTLDFEGRRVGTTPPLTIGELRAALPEMILAFYAARGIELSAAHRRDFIGELDRAVNRVGFDLRLRELGIGTRASSGENEASNVADDLETQDTTPAAPVATPAAPAVSTAVERKSPDHAIESVDFRAYSLAATQATSEFLTGHSITPKGGSLRAHLKQGDEALLVRFIEKKLSDIRRGATPLTADNAPAVLSRSIMLEHFGNRLAISPENANAFKALLDQRLGALEKERAPVQAYFYKKYAEAAGDALTFALMATPVEFTERYPEREGEALDMQEIKKFINNDLKGKDNFLTAADNWLKQEERQRGRQLKKEEVASELITFVLFTYLPSKELVFRDEKVFTNQARGRLGALNKDIAAQKVTALTVMTDETNGFDGWE